MKNILFFLTVFMPFSLPAQSINLDASTTRAVVVGISDYQDKDIPDLQFADRDAVEFAAWLKSPAGGNVPEDNIQLLTNAKATTANIGLTLFNLIDECKAGDIAIIYFSGHGDVETKTIRQNGYLLGYDTPASVYMGVAVPLRDLQDVVSTISEGNKATVLVITDACHSGKLAGSNSGGTQATAQALSEQFAKELKILSCQSNEFSIEGEQWGGGRGVFSYFLLKGLTGLADKNKDGSVSLYEIDRYLSDVVPPETEPQLQTPFTVGDRNAAIAHVDAPSLDRLRREEEQSASLKEINPKGLEDDVLAKADSATKEQYQAFKKAIATGDLLESATGGRSAWDLFQALSSNPQLEPLHRLMRRNFAVALLDEVQQALNALMTDDPYEVNQWRFNSKKYARYPELVQRAIELLGKEHPLYHTLEAKRLFFEAYGITHYGYGASGAQGPDSLKQLARQRLYQALRYDTMAPYVYYLLGNMYLGTFQEDSLTYYYGKAMELAPAWVLPHLELTWDYLDAYMNFEEAGRHVHRALELRPNSYQALETLAWWHQRYNRVDSIEAICHRMRLLRPDLSSDFSTLGVTNEQISKKYDRAVAFFQKGADVDSAVLFCPFPLFKARRFGEAFQQLAWQQDHGSGNSEWVLAFHNLNIQNWHDADSLFQIIFRNSPSRSDRAAYLSFLGKINVQIGRLDTAETILQTSLSTLKTPHPSQSYSLAWLGAIAQGRDMPEKAEAYFQRAISTHPELWTFDYTFVGAEIHILYGDFLADQNRFKEAEEKYQKSIELDPGNYLGYYAMARFHARQGNSTEALDYLEKALDRYYPIPGPIMQEPLFKKIRKTKRFRELMKKNFPELKE